MISFGVRRTGDCRESLVRGGQDPSPRSSTRNPYLVPISVSCCRVAGENGTRSQRGGGISASGHQMI